MSKLGYTWYPKDWGNSESVFELTLIERGLYRELIDIAMLCDNKTQTNIKTWARKFSSTEEEIKAILIGLECRQLIEFQEGTLFIPSCESRLNLVRGGSKGGKVSKPTIKPMLKPGVKPTIKQIEKKGKEIEIENKPQTIDLREIFFNDLPNSSEFETIIKDLKDFNMTKERLISYIPEFRKNAEPSYPNFQRFAAHFKNCVKIYLNKPQQPTKTRHQF